MRSFRGYQIDSKVFRANPFMRLARKLQGKTTQIIRLHGLGDPYQRNLEHIRFLTRRGITVYTLNLPGHGSTEIPTELSWEFIQQLYLEFIQLHGLHDAVWVAYSLGGAVAQKLLEVTSVKKLVMLAPYPPVKLLSRDGAQIAAGFAQHLQEAAKYETKSLPQAEKFTDSQGLLKMYPALLNDFALSANTQYPPTEIIALENDPIFPPRLLQKYFLEIDNVSIQVLSGFTHRTRNLPQAKQREQMRTLLAAIT